MTVRVLVIGTSHAAALRAAAGPPGDAGPLVVLGMDLAFAAVPSAMAGGLRLSDGWVRAADATVRQKLLDLGGRVRFRPAAFNAVVFAGGLSGPFAVSRLHSGARWWPLPSLDRAGGQPPEGVALISRAAALAALCGTAAAAPFAPILAGIAAAGGPRCVVLQEPRVSADVGEAGQGLPAMARIARGPDGDEVSDLYDAACLAAYGGLAHVVLQPMDTREGGFFTARAFRQGATRLAGPGEAPRPQPGRDLLHANAAYGAAVLAALAEALGTARPAAEAAAGG